MKYRQVDVFANRPLRGNGLAVFWECGQMSESTMQELTRELRQFESIFLHAAGTINQYRARIFTMEEQLDFAGHPVLGAAAVLHEMYGKEDVETWQIVLNSMTTAVTTRRDGHGYSASMLQGRPRFLSEIDRPEQIEAIMRSVGLNAGDKHPGLPLSVVGTGLDYLLVPVARNLEKARIQGNVGEMLEELGARFLYVYDVARSEGRTWDNRGLVEDCATGSAAGPVAAFLWKHRLLELGKELSISQGRFAGRPSVMRARVLDSNGEPGRVEVSGSVHMVATGILDSAGSYQ